MKLQLPQLNHSVQESSPWQVQFLGTSDSLGVPRVYCECEVCMEARDSQLNRRLRSSVLLEREASAISGNEHMLIDCGPDWAEQMERTGKRWIDRILVTHAHQDHIAGLPAYADCCRWMERRGQVYAPLEVLQTIQSMYPWLSAHITFTAIEDEWVWEDWAVTPIRVNHGKNGYSYAYRFDRNQLANLGEEKKYSWLYASDAIGLGEKELKHFTELDVLILGTNFYEEPYEYHTRSVYDMVEALQLIEYIQPRQTIFTHMSHGVDVRSNYNLPSHVKLAAFGLELQV
ncbi:MBL fold metallo-hydrolase [Paenibacillus sp. SC116]|uniref:MBL fold metallo-hydrolase n=1 Tax=Paenibacillus sp. SC116 TaxID=2968986 RepID=UPI00215ABDCB|nr:MBL fold metallo-hydrolase [Paenibacillus sp. SC116]MCR8843982.1 MBL fold metallo-hydrolase [Paenibacillus sp. SC116]